MQSVSSRIWTRVVVSIPYDDNHYTIIIIIIIHSLELFTSALADGFSLESEWQQVSSSLQGSSYYSGLSQKRCRLDGLHPSANFQVLQSL